MSSIGDAWTDGPALTHSTARLVGGVAGNHGAVTFAQSLGFAAVTEDSGDPWPGAPAFRPQNVSRPRRDLVRVAGERPAGTKALVWS